MGRSYLDVWWRLKVSVGEVKVRLRIEDRFDAAHRLLRHLGKCKNLHGHTYHVVAVFEGEVSREHGMVEDFGALKEALRIVLEPLDHACLLEKGDPIGPALERMRLKVVYYPCPPTAEAIARFIAEALTRTLERMSLRARVISVSVREGDGGEATYTIASTPSCSSRGRA